MQLNYKSQIQEIDNRHWETLNEANESLVVMTEQIKELQDMKRMAKEEKENANKWQTYYKELELEQSQILHESTEHWRRADKAEEQVKEMAQAITKAAEKAQKDAHEIKDLQETNKLLLERYQQNKSLLPAEVSLKGSPSSTSSITAKLSGSRTPRIDQKASRWAKAGTINKATDWGGKK